MKPGTGFGVEDDVTSLRTEDATEIAGLVLVLVASVRELTAGLALVLVASVRELTAGLASVRELAEDEQSTSCLLPPAAALGASDEDPFVGGRAAAAASVRPLVEDAEGFVLVISEKAGLLFYTNACKQLRVIPQRWG